MSRLLELGFACARLLARVSLPHHSFACLRPRVRFRFFHASLTGMTLTFSFGWPNAPVGNFHPARLPTCRAHERGMYAASLRDEHHLPEEPIVSLKSTLKQHTCRAPARSGTRPGNAGRRIV